MNINNCKKLELNCNLILIGVCMLFTCTVAFANPTVLHGDILYFTSEPNKVNNPKESYVYQQDAAIVMEDGIICSNNILDSNFILYTSIFLYLYHQ